MAKKGDYETFDSGSGPVIPKGDSDSYEHRDSDGGLSSKGDEVEQGAVPTMPQK